MADRLAPRVGKCVIQEGPLLEAIQELYPDKHVVVLDVARGINRMRTCPIGGKGLAPFRRSIGRQRSDLQPFADNHWEEWDKLSYRQQIRAGTPSRLLITVFASHKRGMDPIDQNHSKHLRLSEEDQQTPGAVDPQTAMDNTTPPQPTIEERSITSNPTPNTTSTDTHSDSNRPLEKNIDHDKQFIQHGPKFLALSKHIQSQVKKIHQNLGHPDARVLQLALKRDGWTDDIVHGCSDFVCPICHEQQHPKVARPGQLRIPQDFNDHISFDGAEWKDPNNKSYPFYHFIDTATNFHVAIPYQQRNTDGLIEAFQNAWMRWAGPPKAMMFDSCTEANSEQFARYLQEHSIQSYVIPTDAHWQLGRAERHGGTLMSMIDKYHAEHPITNAHEFEPCLIQLCNAKNSMSRHEGYTPEMWVLGKMKSIPGSNTNTFLDSASFAGLEELSTQGQKFQEQMARREAARLAFVKADHCANLRRALHARSRPNRQTCNVGDLVMYWKEGKGAEKGNWHGPARVLMLEGRNLVWISHMTKLFRCAPEHVRSLSSDEARGVSQEDLRMFTPPEKSGSGVFQFRELSQQNAPDMPEVANPNPIPPLIDLDPITIPNNPPADTPETANLPDTLQAPSIDQPDDERTVPPTPTMDDPAVNTPIPVETDDELVTHDTTHDYWEIQGMKLIRHHVQPRLEMFFPFDAWTCPAEISEINPERFTQGTFASGSNFQRHETWSNNVQSHMPQPEPWTGQTVFTLKQPTQPATTPVCNVQPEEHMGFYAEIEMSTEDINKCLGKTYEYQENFLASAAKRQKVEVKLKELSSEDLKLFQKAKDKELDSWLTTDTVKKILRNKVPEGQLLRSRWVLTWKPLDEIEQKELGATRKAKARLVILGYEDPLIDSLPRDSPTLGRDSRMIALQCIASHRWTVRSFDIRTAFLRGSRQDSRILGMEPPTELRTKMKLQPDEICELQKGTYGLINAPLLWYCELKNALLSLGFVISPMGPCLFVLPKKQFNPEDTCHIHGIVGIHVDDGLGGGDAIFNQAISMLEKKFPFGSQRQGSFTLTGIQLKQERNGEIILSQKDYINDIPPIEISRDRRKTPDAKITTQELQDLRGLIGSLQYAASNSRPDLSCRLSLLQARVTCATVSDLLNGNRLLNDAKKFSETSIRVQALPPDQVRFLSFSDATFATREKAHSQKGCLILATTEDIDKVKTSPVSPLVWFSKKINRVVSSTLASETYALSGALDLLSWTRMHWAWILNPKLEWRQPETTLKSLPNAFAVVDCKSLFDLLQKTSIPQCSEYRTMLEALVIKDRLKEGVLIKWVHSAAQMADSLTKDMDTTVLRTFLRQGICILHDIDEVLKQRADKKVRQQWYQQSSSLESALHVFALCLGF